MALSTLCSEVRMLEETAAATALEAATAASLAEAEKHERHRAFVRLAYDTSAGGAASIDASTLASTSGRGYDASSSPPSSRQLAMQLHIARHEVNLLHEHLYTAGRRTETLQATLEQRELELQRTHESLIDHMRQSGALLGQLAGLVPQTLPLPEAEPPEEKNF